MSTNRVTASRGKRTRARIQGALVYIYNNEKGFQDIRLVSLSFNTFIPRLKQVPSFPSCPLVLISTPRKPFQQYRNTETTKCVTFMLVLQTNPVGLQLFSYVYTLFCFKKLT